MWKEIRDGRRNKSFKVRVGELKYIFKQHCVYISLVLKWQR